MSEKPFCQFRKPSGALGKEIVNSMNHEHYDLTTWGLSLVNISQADSILDIGCGGGRTLGRLARRAKQGMIYGVDYSEDCVLWSSEKNCKEIENGRMQILKASVENLPFDSNKFDKIFAVETVYFWPDLKENFAEVRRVLKPGGVFFIINEAYECEEFRQLNEELKKAGNMKILALNEMELLLRNTGFSEISINTRARKNWMCCAAHKG